MNEKDEQLKADVEIWKSNLAKVMFDTLSLLDAGMLPIKAKKHNQKELNEVSEQAFANYYVFEVLFLDVVLAYHSGHYEKALSNYDKLVSVLETYYNIGHEFVMF